MPRPCTHAELLMALEARYDHASARVVLDEALARAGVGSSDAWDAQAVSRLAWVVSQYPDRPGPAVQALLELAGLAATADVPESPDDVRVPEDQIPALLGEIARAASEMARQRLRTHPRRPPEVKA